MAYSLGLEVEMSSSEQKVQCTVQSWGSHPVEATRAEH